MRDGDFGVHWVAQYELDARVVGDDVNSDVTAEPFDPPNSALPPDNRPAVIQDAAALALSPGSDDAPASLTSADYKLNLALLEPVDEVSLVAVPDRTDFVPV